MVTHVVEGRVLGHIVAYCRLRRAISRTFCFINRTRSKGRNEQGGPTSSYDYDYGNDDDDDDAGNEYSFDIGRHGAHSVIQKVEED